MPDFLIGMAAMAGCVALSVWVAGGIERLFYLVAALSTASAVILRWVAG